MSHHNPDPTQEQHEYGAGQQNGAYTGAGVAQQSHSQHSVQHQHPHQDDEGRYQSIGAYAPYYPETHKPYTPAGQYAQSAASPTAGFAEASSQHSPNPPAQAAPLTSNVAHANGMAVSEAEASHEPTEAAVGGRGDVQVEDYPPGEYTASLQDGSGADETYAQADNAHEGQHTAHGDEDPSAYSAASGTHAEGQEASYAEGPDHEQNSGEQVRNEEVEGQDAPREAAELDADSQTGGQAGEGQPQNTHANGESGEVQASATDTNALGDTQSQDAAGGALTSLEPDPPKAVAFVTKLYDMLNTDEWKVRDLIRWCEPNEYAEVPDEKPGTAFTVFDMGEFSRNVLPRYFKHANWQSFQRQLNLYGFRKINDQTRSTPGNPAVWAFRQKFFRQGNPTLLSAITRRGKEETENTRRKNKRKKGDEEAPFGTLPAGEDGERAVKFRAALQEDESQIAGPSGADGEGKAIDGVRWTSGSRLAGGAHSQAQRLEQLAARIDAQSAKLELQTNAFAQLGRGLIEARADVGNAATQASNALDILAKAFEDPGALSNSSFTDVKQHITSLRDSAARLSTEFLFSVPTDTAVIAATESSSAATSAESAALSNSAKAESSSQARTRSSHADREEPLTLEQILARIQADEPAPAAVNGTQEESAQDQDAAMDEGSNEQAGEQPSQQEHEAHQTTEQIVEQSVEDGQEQAIDPSLTDDMQVDGAHEAANAAARTVEVDDNEDAPHDDIDDVADAVQEQEQLASTVTA